MCARVLDRRPADASGYPTLPRTGPRAREVSLDSGPQDGPDALSGEPWLSIGFCPRRPCRSPVLPSALGSRGEGASFQHDGNALDPQEVSGEARRAMDHLENKQRSIGQWRS